MVANRLTKPLGPKLYSEFVRMLDIYNTRKVGRGIDIVDLGG